MATRAHKTWSYELLRPIRTAFLWASAADESVLDACGPLKSYEERRMAGQGALVVIPSAIAAASLTYAMSTVTSNVTLEVGLGAAFGAVILAIDRYIVSSVHKAQRGTKALLRYYDSAAVGLKRPSRRRVGFGPVLSRGLMTMLISAVASHPIVLLVNRSSIDQQLLTDRNAAVSVIEQDAVAKKAALLSPPGLSQAQAELASERILSVCLGTLLSDEQTGVATRLSCGSSSGVPTQGPIFATDIARKTQVDAQVSTLQAKVDKLNASLGDEEAAIDKNTASQVEELKRSFSTDYPARLHALQELARRKPEVLALQVLLFSFFMMLDVTALTLKLSTPASAYEAALDTLTEEAIVTLRTRTQARLLALQRSEVREAEVTRMAIELELDHTTATIQRLARAHTETGAVIAAETHLNREPSVMTALAALGNAVILHLSVLARRALFATRSTETTL